MRIDIICDESAGAQAGIYAEYRLFAALPWIVDTRRVRGASLELRRASTRPHRGVVVCAVTIALDDGGALHVTASGDHPYAAINRAIDRLTARVGLAADPEDAAPGDFTLRRAFQPERRGAASAPLRRRRDVATH